jgi:hypothetical protein
VNDKGKEGDDKSISFMPVSGGDFTLINGSKTMDANFKGAVYALKLAHDTTGKWWTLDYSANGTSKVCNLYFNATGGTVAEGENAYQTTDANGVVTALPNATREGYTLKGWEDAKGTPINAGDKVTSDTLFFAAWEKGSPDPGPTPPPPGGGSGGGCNAFGVGMLVLAGLALVVKKK